jgi:uncharacterized protein YaaQ
MITQQCDKLIMAILQNDDYPEIVQDLSKHGIYSTIINSSGGFLRKKNITVIIGVDENKLETTLEILKTHARVRIETQYHPIGVGFGSIPIEVETGGVVAFILNVENFVKY